MTTHEPEPAGVIPEAAIRAAAIAILEGDGFTYGESDLHPSSVHSAQARAALLAALPFIVGAEGIKPLEWADKRNGLFRAATPFSYAYFINSRTSMWIGPEDDWVVAEDPKAAAQADFNARIRSALVSAPEAGKAEGATFRELVATLIRQCEASGVTQVPAGTIRPDLEALRQTLNVLSQPDAEDKRIAEPVAQNFETQLQVASIIAERDAAITNKSGNTLASNDAREVASALDLFREFVLHNATQWKLGAGHHHPIWQLVAELLPPSAGRNMSGERWQFIHPENTETLEALSRRHPAPDGGTR